MPAHRGFSWWAPNAGLGRTTGAAVCLQVREAEQGAKATEAAAAQATEAAQAQKSAAEAKERDVEAMQASLWAKVWGVPLSHPMQVIHLEECL